MEPLLHVWKLAVFLKMMAVELFFVEEQLVAVSEDAFAKHSTIAGTWIMFGSIVLQHHLSSYSPERTCYALESSKMV